MKFATSLFEPEIEQDNDIYYTIVSGDENPIRIFPGSKIKILAICFNRSFDWEIICGKTTFKNTDNKRYFILPEDEVLDKSYIKVMHYEGGFNHSLKVFFKLKDSNQILSEEGIANSDYFVGYPMEMGIHSILDHNQPIESLYRIDNPIHKLNIPYIPTKMDSPYNNWTLLDVEGIEVDKANLPKKYSALFIKNNSETFNDGFDLRVFGY